MALLLIALGRGADLTDPSIWIRVEGGRERLRQAVARRDLAPLS